MTSRLANVFGSISFVSCIVLTCASCSTWNAADVSVPNRGSSTPPVQIRLAQMFYGRDATFGTCVESTCPRVTPKTIPSAPSLVPVVHREPVAQRAPEVKVDPRPMSPAPSQHIAMPKDSLTGTIVVNFPFASSALSEDTREAIHASLDTARKADRIVISGRTDSVGDQKSNQALALARAIAVRNHFRDLAPDLPGTISIDAKGRCCFIAPNSDKLGRARNRRVEIAFLTSGDA